MNLEYRQMEILQVIQVQHTKERKHREIILEKRQ